MRNLRELPKFRDGLTYLYVEHAIIEQEAKGIAIFDEDGMTMVPVASLGVLMLGPGTRITHAAIRSLCDNGCTVLWVGENMVRFYAQGLGETRSARRLYKQARAWADPDLHMRVVMRLYRFRFPHELPEDLTLQQLRGLEGVRVRDTYTYWSRKTGVPWKGRSYNRQNWKASDAINRALSAGASCLYGLCHAAIVSMGFSPALGFIHTGKLLSFVYDVADLYKTELLVPTAFCIVAENEENIERRVRRELRHRIREVRWMERVVTDLLRLFRNIDVDDSEDLQDVFEEDPTQPTKLWDPEGEIEGGKSYGGDDSGKGPEEFTG